MTLHAAGVDVAGPTLSPMRQGTDDERDAVLSYVESQSTEDRVVHVEKVATEAVGSVVHDIWDVHCSTSRWWVVSNPMNLYSQDDFKSRDVVLTFHVGLMLRVATQHNVAITDEAATLLPEAWRLWEQATDTLSTAREAEDFQSVGVRLRESMVSYAGEVQDDRLVPDGVERPKSADVIGWTNLLTDHLAGGSSSGQLRSYVKKLGRETWDYVNKLTHAKNATRWDAEIGAAAVSHFLATITATTMRSAAGAQPRCADCGSYRVENGRCVRCRWTDPSYEAPRQREITEDELADRLASPCMPSSDISTLMSPEHLR